MILHNLLQINFIVREELSVANFFNSTQDYVRGAVAIHVKECVGVWRRQRILSVWAQTLFRLREHEVKEISGSVGILVWGREREFYGWDVARRLIKVVGPKDQGKCLLEKVNFYLQHVTVDVEKRHL